VSEKDITELYCFIGDFCKIYQEHKETRLSLINFQRNRDKNIILGEIPTIYSYKIIYIFSDNIYYGKYIGIIDITN
jgi:hypothetical protein